MKVVELYIVNDNSQVRMIILHFYNLCYILLLIVKVKGKGTGICNSPNSQKLTSEALTANTPYLPLPHKLARPRHY